jgi:hypothetical protein
MLNNQRTACRVAESTSGMISLFASFEGFQVSQSPSDNSSGESQWLRETLGPLRPRLNRTDRDRIPIRDGLQIQKLDRW